MEHTSPTHCPRCGTSLDQDSVQGLCSKCLGALNFATDTGLPAEPVAAVPPPSPEEIAAHFPQLEIIEFLGRGGMGVVYKARQRALSRLVALKLLAPERAGDPQFASRFEKEAQALATLSHSSIVAVHDFGQAGGFYYLLMEYVDGVNLRQAMRSRRFTPEQALAIVPSICEALQYAHEHGIVHRDIKPENLLLDKDGRVKIADFGIAKMLGAETSSVGMAESQPAGTPQYMAPEQKEHRLTDHRADIYSLGVVLYEMLTGELPADKLQPPSRRVQVDVRIDEIVLRALEKTPELRFQTAGEFGTRLETVARGPGSAAAPAVSTGLVKSERGRITWEHRSGSAMTNPAMGEVALYGDRLVISLGTERREIPLEAIRALREALPPVWWAPAGPSFAAIDYDTMGQMLRVAFLPGTAAFRTKGDTQRHTAEWLTAVQAAIQLRIRRDFPLTPGTSSLKLAFSHGALLWLPAALALGVFLLTALSQRRPGQGFPIGALLPIIVLTSVTGIGILSRYSRSIVPESPEPKADPKSVGQARISRLAVFGACWVPAAIVALLAAWLVLSIPGEKSAAPEWWQPVIMLPLLIVAVTGPFGTTILGWLAVAEISRSHGHVHGLQLALFDGLVYPIVALGGIIAGGVVYVGRSLLTAFGAPGSETAAPAFIVPAAAAVAIVVNVFVVRAVQRAVREDAAAAPADSSSTGNEVKLASVAIIFALISTALAAMACLRSSGAWTAMALALVFAGITILLALPVRRLAAGKCALIIAALGMVLWPLLAWALSVASVAPGS